MLPQFLELKEYANDMEIELIRSSIKAIGTIILRVDKAAKRAVEILQELVNTGQPLCLQEAVIVARDIFRKFPNKYDALIKDLCSKLLEYYEPEAKAAIIWIIGEYAEKVTESEKIIDSFADAFLEEPDKVKLQILTAAVKLFLKKPEEGEDVIQKVLKLATEESDNPDLRDRAYIYWRMLSTSPQNTKQVVLGEKPHIADDSYNQYDDTLVSALIDQISTLGSVYHKTQDELANMQKRAAGGQPSVTPQPKKEEEEPVPQVEEQKEKKKAKKQEEEEPEEKPKKKKKAEEKPAKAEKKKAEEPVKEVKPAPVAAPTNAGLIDIDDLLGMGDSQPVSQAPQQQQQSQNQFMGGLMDFGLPSQPQQQPPAAAAFSNPFGDEEEEDSTAGAGWAADFGGQSTPAEDYSKYFLTRVHPLMKEVVGNGSKGKDGKTGLVVKAGFSMANAGIQLVLDIRNGSGQIVKDFDIMFNKNPFGIAIYGAANAIDIPDPGMSTVQKALPCVIDKKNLDAKNPPKHPFNVQVALKSSLDVFYFEVPCLLYCLIDTKSPMQQEEFKKFWEMIPKANESVLSIPSLYPGYIHLGERDLASNLVAGLTNNGFTSLASVAKPGATMLYFGAKTVNNLPLLLEIAAVQGSTSVSVTYRVPVAPLKPLLEDTLDYILSSERRA